MFFFGTAFDLCIYDFVFLTSRFMFFIKWHIKDFRIRGDVFKNKILRNRTFVLDNFTFKFEKPYGLSLISRYINRYAQDFIFKSFFHARWLNLFYNSFFCKFMDYIVKSKIIFYV